MPYVRRLVHGIGTSCSMRRHGRHSYIAEACLCMNGCRACHACNIHTVVLVMPAIFTRLYESMPCPHCKYPFQLGEQRLLICTLANWFMVISYASCTCISALMAAAASLRSADTRCLAAAAAAAPPPPALAFPHADTTAPAAPAAHD